MTIQVYDQGDEFGPEEPYDLHEPDQFDGADDDGEFIDPRYGRVSGMDRPSISYVNESGLPQDVIERHFRDKTFQREVASQIEQWNQSLSSTPVNQTLDVFNRSRGLKNEVHIHATMARCSWAMENDDTLSTLADVIEGLMWQKCRFELIDEDQQDVWNQWAAQVNLDIQLRKMGREELKVSQFYVGLWWAKQNYKVRNDTISDEIDRFEVERIQVEFRRKARDRQAFIDQYKDQEGYIEPPALPDAPKAGRGQGNHGRRKEFSLLMPTALTIFDPCKILPVGMLMFGRERFCYIANRYEDESFTQAMSGEVLDSTVLQLVERKYVPNGQDRQACQDLGVNPDQLWLLKEDAVFRHTMTRADYERYAPVRMKTILPILEMKQHLRNSDKASLIGNTNFIVLITKGSDRMPAKNAEIENLKAQARTVARLPVLVGDHRLHVEIISPKLDNTLTESRWQVLDSRLVFATLRTFSPVVQTGGSSTGSGVSEMSRVVSKGLESRRHMLLRALEQKIFQVIVDRNPDLDEHPNLEFSPKRITLDFNKDVIGGVLKLRDRGDISRETTLEEMDYDQDREVLRRGRERVLYDSVFESSTPFSSPNANPFAASGAAGASNLGPNGQPVTEGGRPPGVTEDQPRATTE